MNLLDYSSTRRSRLRDMVVPALVLLLGLAQVSAAQTTGDSFASGVIYQVVTDRFSDGNSANNPAGDLFSSGCTNLRKYCGGDWQGLIDKINDGYLTEMGVSTLWISPPVENTTATDPAGTAAYHGYWARDFKKTNPFFGSFSDFQNLINTAHANGMKVVIDFAPNHTSSADEGNPSFMENGALYDNGTFVASLSNDPNGYFHHNGETSFSTYEDGIYRSLFNLADLNQQAPFVDNYMNQAIKGWLDRGIDGIRMDAVKHMSFGWQKTFMDEIYGHRPVFTFGEWFLGAGEVDPENHFFANESGMSLLDFRFGQKIRQVLRDNSDDWNGFYNMILGTASDYHEVADQVTFIDNHDIDRFSTAGGDTRKTDLALVVALTSRGVPNIYYGTEQYLTGNGDPDNRKMMSSFSRSTRAYQVIKKLAPLRRTNAALAYGGTQERWINSDVFIYERTFGNDVALVAVNRSTSTWHHVTGLFTALPAASYADELAGLLDGFSITVNGDGSVDSFWLGPGRSAVWANNGSAASPSIGQMIPMLGRTGQPVTIHGEGFGSSAGTVQFGTASAAIVSWSDTRIEVTVPSVSAGYRDVTVTRSGGGSGTYERFEVLSGDQVSVRFVVKDATTSWGQNVYLVGGVHELEEWNTSEAIGPTFNQIMYQYPDWYYDVNVPGGTFLEYKFIKKDASGNVVWECCSNHSFTSPSTAPGEVVVFWQGTGKGGPAQTEEVAFEFALQDAYPNPFSESTSLEFSLPETQHVTLRVVDLLGRTVAALVDDIQSPGRHRVDFDAHGLPSGVYFYQIETYDRRITKMVTLAR